MLKVAIAGHIDNLVLGFCERLAADPQISLIGLGREAYDVDFIDTWRLGSQVSSRDTENTLTGVDLAIYFCLGRSEQRSGEGEIDDVALMQAIQFIREAQRHEGLRVILVSRLFDASVLPDGCPIYKVYSEISFLFHDSGLRLNHLRVAPILSEYDPITRHALRLASAFAMRFDHKKYYNLTQPLAFDDFCEALIGIVKKEKKRTNLVGAAVLRYSEFLEELQKAMRGSGFALPSLALFKATSKRLGLSVIKDEARKVFEETLKIHTSERSDGSSSRDELSKQIKALAKSYKKGMQTKEPLYKPKTLVSDTQFTRCVVQRLLYNPNRSVEQIADLLMAWLPRRLNKILQVKRVDEHSLECLMLRIPLFKLKKCVDGEQQSRIILSSNFLDDKTILPNFLLFSTALEDPIYGVLMILLEHSPSSKIALALEKYIIKDFAKYLHEFKIGEWD
ncbi:MAG: hypothetical protein WC966_08760 [Bradymonadales bacterium]|jgi:hypothetical protein